ncbi:MAG: hypothetical protein JWM11_4588 [Planctomycetaceae bacterium]|nr:hypothetical protein [Planctomycetaceae bacterium]
MSELIAKLNQHKANAAKSSREAWATLVKAGADDSVLDEAETLETLDRLSRTIEEFSLAVDLVKSRKLLVIKVENATSAENEIPQLTAEWQKLVAERDAAYAKATEPIRVIDLQIAHRQRLVIDGSGARQKLINGANESNKATLIEIDNERTIADRQCGPLEEDIQRRQIESRQWHQDLPNFRGDILKEKTSALEFYDGVTAEFVEKLAGLRAIVNGAESRYLKAQENLLDPLAAI